MSATYNATVEDKREKSWKKQSPPKPHVYFYGALAAIVLALYLIKYLA